MASEKTKKAVKNFDGFKISDKVLFIYFFEDLDEEQGLC